MPRKKIPVAVPQGSKCCHGCQQVKPVQSFWIGRSKKDERHYCCIRCGTARRWSAPSGGG